MTWGTAPYSQLRVAAAPGYVQGWSGLRSHCCSIPGPTESSGSVQPMAEQDMVIPGSHQLALLSTGILPGGGGDRAHSLPRVTSPEKKGKNYPGSSACWICSGRQSPRGS